MDPAKERGQALVAGRELGVDESTRDEDETDVDRQLVAREPAADPDGEQRERPGRVPDPVIGAGKGGDEVVPGLDAGLSEVVALAGEAPDGGDTGV